MGTETAASGSRPLAEDVARLAKGEPARVHMAGIGGVGMAGLALILKAREWEVDGCDSVEGPLLPWLREHGISVRIGHGADHLDDAPAMVVRSPAVRMSEEELVRAKSDAIPVVDRGALLPAMMSPYRLIAVSGTHGKTSTASMIAWILTRAGETTSYCIGGVCPNLGAVAHVEKDGYMVIEADESDGTLQLYRPQIAVVTSMDVDHVDYYTSEAQHEAVYRTFASGAETIVYNADDERAATLFGKVSGATAFGIDDGVGDLAAREVVTGANGSRFEVYERGTRLGTVTLGISGRHNIANALAAIAATRAVGIDFEKAAAALAEFRLPLRRFECVAQGKGITVITDYAHHPVEIRAMMEQAGYVNHSRMVALFQPHRYSRTKAFLREFADVLETANALILLPVYAASEPLVLGGETDDLYDEVRRRGHDAVELADSVCDAWNCLQKTWREGDLVLLIGAGDIEAIGPWAAKALEEA